MFVVECITSFGTFAQTLPDSFKLNIAGEGKFCRAFLTCYNKSDIITLEMKYSRVVATLI